MLYHKLYWGVQEGGRIFTGGAPEPPFEPPLRVQDGVDRNRQRVLIWLRACRRCLHCPAIISAKRSRDNSCRGIKLHAVLVSAYDYRRLRDR